jgi:hypothetical protein
MYSSLPSFLLAFHGCDKKTKENILSGKDKLKHSCNEYDWLGNGIYFWENDPDRALSYSKLIKEHPERCNYRIEEPDVIGAVIDLKRCLNLFEEKALGYLKKAYTILEMTSREANMSLPENVKIEKEGDVLIRRLDCAVFETLHRHNKENKIPAYDSIRSPFWEGKELYPNSGFKEKNHIQICIRNPNCIKGYFNPLDPDTEWTM